MFFLLFYRFCESIVLKQITKNYCSIQMYSHNDVVLTKVHVVCMSVEEHLILAVTSLNSKTKENNLHIYYTLD